MKSGIRGHVVRFVEAVRNVLDKLLGRQASTSDADVWRIIRGARSGYDGGASSDQGARHSISPETRNAYEDRIDALFQGASRNRRGIKVLDRADILDVLGYGFGPLHLVESAVGKRRDGGSVAHPSMTADQWKRVPNWIENPAAVFRSATVDGRLTLVAPETVDGKPVLVVLEPNGEMAGMSAHVLVNAYEKDSPASIPVGKWVNIDKSLLYLDQKKSPEVGERSGLQLPRDVRQLRGYQHNVLTESDLGKYRQSASPLLSVAPEAGVLPLDGDDARAAPPEETLARRVQRRVQDKFNRFTVILDWLKEQGITLSQGANVYRAEERMHGRIAAKVEGFRKVVIQPLVKEIQDGGYSMSEVAEFLHAQHAKERSRQIAKVNKDMTDGGSGMATA